MLLETILTAVLFFAGTALSGYTIRHILKLKQEGFLFSILVGCMGWWALMEVILIPMTMKLQLSTCLCGSIRQQQGR